MTSRFLGLSFKTAVLGVVLGLCFDASVLAQSNSTGILAGSAAAGDVVTAENIDNGFTRTVTVTEKAKFRLPGLPIGTYQVTIKHADGTVYFSQKAAVRIGLTTRVTQ